MVEIYVPIAGFIMLVSITAIIAVYRYRTKRELQETMRQALTAGPGASAETVEQLMLSLQPKSSDLRRGIVAVAIALAALICAFVVDPDEVLRPLVGLSAFPLFVGVAYLILWRIGRQA